MLSDILMFFFTYFFTIHIFKKLSNDSLTSFITFRNNILLAIGLSIFSYILKMQFVELTYLLPLLLMWIHFSIYCENPRIIILLLLSYLISYGMWTISSLIIVILALPLRHVSWNYFNDILSIFVGLFHTVSIHSILKIKRLRFISPLIHSLPIFNIVTTFSLIVFTFLINRPNMKTTYFTRFLILLSLIIIFLLLIHWWQGQITKSYKRSLQLRELESLRMELEDKEKRITELSKQNEELGRLIHKDNKLIPAMEHAVHEYFITDFDTLDAAKEKAQTLLLEIEELSKNRHNIILEINNAHSKHYATGIPALDTLLNYMDKRALQEHIALSVHLGVDLSNYIPTTITSEDLTHLLSDLLENAIIACKGTSNANIQLQFYKSEKAFVIEIADNGIPFEIDSLVNFGITKLTTHADSGGSGIGLMDIWKIKEKYFASIHITELEANTPFSKKIAIIFNKKHRYSISSKRKEQLMQASKRADIHIFD